MALTDLEKKLLDELVKKVVAENKGKKFLKYQLVEYFRCSLPNCNNTSILASIKRTKLESNILYTNGVYSINVFKFKVISMGSHFKKEKNLLFFDTRPEQLIYDFNTNTFNIDKSAWSEIVERRIFYISDLLKYEWIFNYIDNIGDIASFSSIEETFIEKMPVGFYQEIVKNGELTPDMLIRYNLKLRYGKYSEFIYSLISNTTISLKNWFLFFDYCKPQDIIKMMSNSFLNGDILNIYPTIKKLVRHYITLTDNGCNNVPKLDNNRDLKNNYEMLELILNEKRNAILSEKMQRLNFIHNTIIDDYIIVVPQSQEDKVEEGKMQHNCVGYYYDESILKNENLIYFLRKKDSPKKSYITCRYNLSRESTVEARKCNNISIKDDKEQKIIETISKIIREQLGE